MIKIEIERLAGLMQVPASGHLRREDGLEAFPGQLIQRGIVQDSGQVEDSANVPSAGSELGQELGHALEVADVDEGAAQTRLRKGQDQR